MEIKKFKDLKEFAEHKAINKTIYSNMTYKEKLELKKYVYGLNEKPNKKDIIWEYLNEPIGTDYFIYTSLMLNGIQRRK